MTPVIGIASSYTANMLSNIANSESNSSTYTGSLAGAAYNNAVSYVNSRTVNDLSDVTISSAADGDFLRYSSVLAVWINDPVNLATDTIGSYVESLVAGTGITLSNNSGEGSTPTVAVDTTVVAPLASPTFTGTVSGITKSMVDLASVDNTADTAKPISTAQQIALDLKANLASPTFTGTVTLPDNTVALGTKTTGDYVQALNAGTGIAISNNSGEGSTPTIEIENGSITSDKLNLNYVELITAGNNIVLSEDFGVGALNPEISVSATPSFYTITTENLVVDGIEIRTNGAVFGQVLKFDGTNFTPDEDSAEAGTGTLSKHSSTIGDGSTTVFTVTHSLGTRDVNIDVYDLSTYETVVTSARRTTVNAVEITFSTAPSNSSRRVVITG